jgi:MraZ protein
MAHSDLIFKGEFIHQLDEKVRFKLPVKMEEVFEEIGLHCVLMKMPEKCLALYSASVWQQEYGQFLSGSGKGMPGNSDYRSLSRLLASRCVNLKIGVQGRVALPESFQSYLGIEKKENIVIVGAGDRIEIWSEGKWAEAAEGADQQFFELLEEASTRVSTIDNLEGEKSSNEG